MRSCPRSQLGLLARSVFVVLRTYRYSSCSLNSMLVTRASKKGQAQLASPGAPEVSSSYEAALDTQTVVGKAANGSLAATTLVSARAIVAAAMPAAAAAAAVDQRQSMGPVVAAPAAAEAAGNDPTSGQQAAKARRRRRGGSTTISSTRPQATASDQTNSNVPSNNLHKTARRPHSGAVEANQNIAAAAPKPVNTLAPSKRRRKAATASTAAAEAQTAAAAADQLNSAAEVHAAAAAGSVTEEQLFDLGDLLVGELVKRPSATVKTPYVADVRLADGSMVLAHTPSLDCAGLIVPGSRVYMTANAPRTDKQQAIKTTHAVQLAEDLRDDGHSALVGAHPNLAEKIAEAAVQQHLLPLPEQLQGYTSVLKQQTLGLGRFDFVLCYDDGRRLLLEVKNAVCADFPADQVPLSRSKSGVYLSHAKPYQRTALFPIGTSSNKKAVGVVSDRAIKHLHELTQLQQAGQDSEGRPVQCAVLFIVNRGDCAAFRPCHEADMMFARMLHRAQQQGVLVMAHDVHWQGGKAMWGKQLPVMYDDGVTGADVDEEHLVKVLSFNAVNPRTHWKKAKQQQG